MLVIFLGCIGFGIWLARWERRPQGPLRLAVVAGIKPATAYVRSTDGYSVREWDVAKPLDEVVGELSRQLQPSDGWQPPTTRSLDPKKIQFARVHAGRDFLFDRVVITESGPSHSVVTIEESPPQVGAFRQ